MKLIISIAFIFFICALAIALNIRCSRIDDIDQYDLSVRRIRPKGSIAKTVIACVLIITVSVFVALLVHWNYGYNKPLFTFTDGVYQYNITTASLMVPLISIPVSIYKKRNVFAHLAISYLLSPLCAIILLSILPVNINNTKIHTSINKFIKNRRAQWKEKKEKKQKPKTLSKISKTTEAKESTKIVKKTTVEAKNSEEAEEKTEEREYLLCKTQPNTAPGKSKPFLPQKLIVISVLSLLMIGSITMIVIFRAELVETRKSYELLQQTVCELQEENDSLQNQISNQSKDLNNLSEKFDKKIKSLNNTIKDIDENINLIKTDIKNLQPQKSIFDAISARKNHN